MIAAQILIDGFTLSALYALGATGFTLIFGVSGVLNLSHGALMVTAAVLAWAAGVYWNTGPYLGAALGILACVGLTLLTYFLIVLPIMQPIMQEKVLSILKFILEKTSAGKSFARTGFGKRVLFFILDARPMALPEREKEIFVLTATLLWGIMAQELIAYFFTNNSKAVLPFVDSLVTIFGVRTPANKLVTAVICWAAIAVLWLLVNRTRAGKAVLAASMNPRGVTLLGIELSWIYLAVWMIYGVLAGIAGVLLGQFFNVGSENVGPLTASAFSIVVLGGLGSVAGSLIAAYAVGYLETATAYLVNPAYRTIPALLLLVIVIYVRPRGLFGRR